MYHYSGCFQFHYSNKFQCVFYIKPVKFDKAEYWLCKCNQKIFKWARKSGKQKCDCNSPTAKNVVCNFLEQFVAKFTKVHESIVFT